MNKIITLLILHTSLIHSSEITQTRMMSLNDRLTELTETNDIFYDAVGKQPSSILKSNSPEDMSQIVADQVEVIKRKFKNTLPYNQSHSFFLECPKLCNNYQGPTNKYQYGSPCAFSYELVKQNNHIFFVTPSNHNSEIYTPAFLAIRIISLFSIFSKKSKLTILQPVSDPLGSLEIQTQVEQKGLTPFAHMCIGSLLGIISQTIYTQLNQTFE